MQKLISGLHVFQNTIFGPKKAFFEHLAQGQSPEVMFITCADSRISPSMLTQTQPGDLFIVRNAGNLVTPHGGGLSGEAASIEFAIEGLKVRDIVICGHSHCGAMKAVLEPSMTDSMPSVKAWLRNADSTHRIMKQNYKHLEGTALLTATAQENVLVQLDNLRTLPSVAAALSAGKLKLHGWVYKIETGEVFAFDPDQGQFTTVTGKPAVQGTRTAPAMVGI